MTTPDAEHRPEPSPNRPMDFVAVTLRRVRWSHVTGELALVVVGVLVALGINNWYADRQLRRTEAGMLRELRRALSADLVSLQEADSSARNRERRMVALRSHLLGNSPYADTLKASFGAVLGIWEVHLNRAPYEALKVKGLDLVSSDSLRAELIRLYEYVYADLEVSEGDDRNVTFDVVRPYFLKAFREIRFRESATPLDYAGTARDPYFLNLVDYRLASLHANSITPVERAMSSVRNILALIDRGLPEQ